MGHDYSEYVEKATPDQLEQLGKLAVRLGQAVAAVAHAETVLAEAQQNLKQLREHEIPELMLAIGMKSFTTTSGLSISLREEVRATLPKDADRRERAFEWLKEHGHTALIKHVMTLKFNKNQYDQAQRIAQVLRDAGLPVPLERKDDVHHSTLCAFLREQLDKGGLKPDDLSIFGGFIQKFAEVD